MSIMQVLASHLLVLKKLGVLGRHYVPIFRSVLFECPIQLIKKSIFRLSREGVLQCHPSKRTESHVICHWQWEVCKNGRSWGDFQGSLQIAVFRILSKILFFVDQYIYYMNVFNCNHSCLNKFDVNLTVYLYFYPSLLFCITSLWKYICRVTVRYYGHMAINGQLFWPQIYCTFFKLCRRGWTLDSKYMYIYNSQLCGSVKAFFTQNLVFLFCQQAEQMMPTSACSHGWSHCFEIVLAKSTRAIFHN